MRHEGERERREEKNRNKLGTTLGQIRGERKAINEEQTRQRRGSDRRRATRKRQKITRKT